MKVTQLSDSLQSHGLYSPWNSPGQNTGVGSLSLLQGIFPTQESNWGLLHCKWILYQLSYQGSPLKSVLVCFCFMFWVFGGQAFRILAPGPGIKPALEGEILPTGVPSHSWSLFLVSIHLLILHSAPWLEIPTVLYLNRSLISLLYGNSLDPFAIVLNSLLYHFSKCQGWSFLYQSWIHCLKSHGPSVTASGLPSRLWGIQPSNSVPWHLPLQPGIQDWMLLAHTLLWTWAWGHCSLSETLFLTLKV